MCRRVHAIVLITGLFLLLLTGFLPTSDVEAYAAENEITKPGEMRSYTEPFYGIWCIECQDSAVAWEACQPLLDKGYHARVYTTTDWSNLNPTPMYAATAGVYYSEQEANIFLPIVQIVYPNAYVKYSGDFIGVLAN